MCGSITIKLPLKPYIVKFLEKRYGKKHLVSRNSLIGMYLIELLNKDYNKRGSIEEGSYYTIIVPSSIVARVGFDFPAVKYEKLASYFEKLFRNSLFEYVNMSIENDLKLVPEHDRKKIRNQNAKEAIKQFLSTYEICEDELKFETMYRTYYREVNRTELAHENLKLSES